MKSLIAATTTLTTRTSSSGVFMEKNDTVGFGQAWSNHASYITMVQDLSSFGAIFPKKSGLTAENSKRSCAIVIEDDWHITA